MNKMQKTSTRHTTEGIRRQRAINSCRACRARRVKCDKVHPTCGRCAKSGDICLYIDNHRRNPSQNKPNGATQSQNQESTSETWSPGSATHQDVPQATDALEVLETIEKRRAEETSLPAGDTNGAENGDAVSGHLAVRNGGRSRYVGNTFWAYVGDEDQELDSLLGDIPVFSFPTVCACDTGVLLHTDRPYSSCDGRSRRQTPELLWPPQTLMNGGCNRLRTLDKMLEAIPPKDMSDLFYQNFLDSIHGVYPLIHPPTFHSQYLRFWSWFETWDRRSPPEGILAEIPSIVPLMFAIFFAGSVACSAKDMSKYSSAGARSAISTTLYKSTMHSLSLAAFPKSPTIYSLIAFIIAQNLLLREEESISTTSYISVALRISQAMGLHRDGSHFKIDPIQVEIRRRIWWHLIHTDVLTAVSAGMPPIMTDNNLFDTHMISDLKDDYITSNKESTPTHDVPSSERVDSRYCVAIGRYQVTTIMRNLLRRQFHVKPMTLEDVKAQKDTVDQIAARTNERIDRMLLRRFHNNARNGHAQNGDETRVPDNNQAAFHEWGQHLLRLMVDKAYCMLYQPLIRGGSGSMWLYVRQDCIKHSHSFLQTFIEMCTTQSFRPFFWIYPGLYQPLQATAVLLADLLRRPTSPEAPRSRMLVEGVFSLLGPDGRVVGKQEGIVAQGVSSGARQAWNMLRRLRKKAWEKAGQDPGMVWQDAEAAQRMAATTEVTVKSEAQQGLPTQSQSNTMPPLPAFTNPTPQPLASPRPPDPTVITLPPILTQQPQSHALASPSQIQVQTPQLATSSYPNSHLDAFNMPAPDPSSFTPASHNSGSIEVWPLEGYGPHPTGFGDQSGYVGLSPENQMDLDGMDWGAWDSLLRDTFNIPGGEGLMY